MSAVMDQHGVSAAASVDLSMERLLQSMMTAPRLATHVSVDKPLYRPGETVRIFAVRADPLTLRPVSSLTLRKLADNVRLSPPRCVIVDGKGVQVATVALSTDESSSRVDPIAWGEWVIPPGQNGGDFTIKVSYDGSNAVSAPPAVRKFSIRSYRARDLRLSATFERMGYGAGEEVVAKFKALDSTGKPAALAQLTAWATVGGTSVWTSKEDAIMTDSTGSTRISFILPDPLPPTSADDSATLSVRVKSNGLVETLTSTIPLVTTKVEVNAYPESGELVQGVPTRVFLEAWSLSGEPVDVVARVCEAGLKPSDDGGEVSAGLPRDTPMGPVVTPDSTEPLCLATIVTAHEGRGVSSQFIPSAKILELHITHPPSARRTIELPKVREWGAVIEPADSNPAVFPGNAPVDVTVRSSHPASLRVTLWKKEERLASMVVSVGDSSTANSILSQTTSRVFGPSVGSYGHASRVSLRPPKGPLGYGVLRVTVTESGTGAPLAERLVFRAPRSALKVELAVTEDSDSAVPWFVTHADSGDAGTLALQASATVRRHASFNPAPLDKVLKPVDLGMFTPSGRVRVHVKTTMEGHPVPAVVALSMVDAPSLEMTEARKRHPRLTAQLLLEDEINPSAQGPEKIPMLDPGAYLGPVFPGSGAPAAYETALAEARQSQSLRRPVNEPGTSLMNLFSTTLSQLSHLDEERQLQVLRQQLQADPLAPLDLLLGTQGWRTFAYQHMDQLSKGIIPAHLLSRHRRNPDDRPDAPLVGTDSKPGVAMSKSSSHNEQRSRISDPDIVARLFGVDGRTFQGHTLRMGFHRRHGIDELNFLENAPVMAKAMFQAAPVHERGECWLLWCAGK
jgi:alpha-2-macroglobulin-like protein